jgi:hypothetical protein
MAATTRSVSRRASFEQRLPGLTSIAVVVPAVAGLGIRKTGCIAKSISPVGVKSASTLTASRRQTTNAFASSLPHHSNRRNAGKHSCSWSGVQLITWLECLARVPLSALPAAPELRRKPSTARDHVWLPNLGRAPRPLPGSPPGRQKHGHTPMSRRPGSWGRKQAGTMGRCSRAWPRKRKPAAKRWRAIRWTPAMGYRSPPRRPGKPHPRTGDSREPIFETLDKNDNAGRAWLRSNAGEKRARNEKAGVRCETGASSIWTMPTCACGSTEGTKALSRDRRIGLLDARRFTIRAVLLGGPQIPPLRYPGFAVDLGGVDELHAILACRGTGAKRSDGDICGYTRAGFCNERQAWLT